MLMSGSAGAPSPAAAEGATASDTEATAEDPLADPNLTPEKPFLDQEINLENTEPLTDQKSVNEDKNKKQVSMIDVQCDGWGESGCISACVCTPFKRRLGSSWDTVGLCEANRRGCLRMI